MLNSLNINILLADDDNDDCMFFKEALEELPLQTTLHAVHNGEQLMKLLNQKTDCLPDVLFLDLNMPRKNGFTCLEEIKCSEKLKALPVIIYSTSYDRNNAEQLYKNGAIFYICKPADFNHLKKVIYQALILITQKNNPPTGREKYLLTGESVIIPDSI